MAKDNISPEERARRIKEMEASDVYDPSNPKNLYDNDMVEAASGDQLLGRGAPQADGSLPKLRMGIVGHGFVGQAVDYAFTHSEVEKFFVDPKYGTTIDDLIEWSPHLCFVCAPTPMSDNGFVDASIVEDAVLKLFEHTDGAVIVKSTITPDVVDRLANSLYDEDVKRLVYNPEFLTESNAKEQFVNAPYHILGGHPEATGDVEHIYKMFSLCSAQKYYHMSAPEASFVKYGVNSFLATKVTFFNQLYDAVHKFGCNWPGVVTGVTADPRIGVGHSKVPGYDSKRGFGGACFPKDLKAFNLFDPESLTILAEVGNINNNYRKEYELDDREKSNNISYNEKTPIEGDLFEGEIDVDNGQAEKELED